METTKTECPFCDGTGYIIEEADDMFGNTIKFRTQCYECEGEGYLNVRS